MTWRWRKEWRRERLRNRAFPAAWGALLQRSFFLYGHLSADDRRELESLVLIFLAEKRFEGAAGLRMRDEIRLAIAAQACLLLLHRATDIYPGLASIIVYPGEYLARQKLRDEIGLVREATQVRLGETGGRGAVVVSWAAAMRGAAGANGGRNIVFHEFAHLLDAQSGGFDGAPILPSTVPRAEWTQAMAETYAEIRARSEAGEAGALDAYAATSPAEFFAVATERFFQDPHGLSRDAPALFEALRLFYRQDPREWEPERRHD